MHHRLPLPIPTHSVIHPRRPPLARRLSRSQINNPRWCASGSIDRSLYEPLAKAKDQKRPDGARVNAGIYLSAAICGCGYTTTTARQSPASKLHHSIPIMRGGGWLGCSRGNSSAASCAALSHIPSRCGIEDPGARLGYALAFFFLQDSVIRRI